ncbi:MAG: hypothetical protein AVDCRST_MAG23-86, partial [uncultured Sphingosinicella sp.]
CCAAAAGSIGRACAKQLSFPDTERNAADRCLSAKARFYPS